MESTNPANLPNPRPGTIPASGPHPHHSLVTAAGEQCPSCGTPVAADQRYCLNCGQRCGEPRLPFMNAVTFMEAMKRPTASASPPSKPRRRLSPNAALITGVGTLLLALGVGVLIGHSGNNSGGTSAATPQVITVNGGSGAESATASTGSTAGKGGSKSSKGNKKSAKTAAKRAASGTGAEEILKPTGNVKLPPATVKPGGKCPPGSAGCKGGEFTGEFFGE